MQFTRCRDQSDSTLEMFYRDLIDAEAGQLAAGANAMLCLIDRLHALPAPERVYGLTSLHRLCLLSEDSWKSPWHIIVSAADDRFFQIEYLLPERMAPWPNAYVRGEAHSLDDAIEKICIAMQRSEGWVE